MSDKPRMLWVARDTRALQRLSLHLDRPSMNQLGLWGSEGRQSSIDAPGIFDNLQPGECRMFIEFAPRVATYPEGAGMVLAWAESGWVWRNGTAIRPGDIILPMPPDPTPYLPGADHNAARREEIRAQMAALQEELEGMEG